MAGWHHRLDGRESEWTPRVGDRQGGLVCCDSWGCKESDMTERLNWTEALCKWYLIKRILPLFKCVMDWIVSPSEKMVSWALNFSITECDLFWIEDLHRGNKVIRLGHKKGWNNAICSNTDGPRDCHTGWSTSGRERQISYNVTYMWNLFLIDFNLFFNRHKWTLQNRNRHKCWKQTYCYQRGKVVRRDKSGGELEMNIHTLLCIRSITNKDLQHSTGNSSQYSVMTYMRK